MIQEYNYRVATLDDVKELQQLCLLSYGQFKPVISVENWKIWEKNFNDENTFLILLKKGRCFICKKETEIIGMAFLISHGNPYLFFETEWSYIRLVAVNPKYEGKGIGKKLTQLCIDFGRESGEKIIALHTSEFQDAARHIYESMGFVKLKDLDLMFGKQYYLYTLKLNNE